MELAWFSLNPDHSSAVRRRKDGGAVANLMLCQNDVEPVSLGLVCQMANGKFWVVENHPMVVCRKYSGQTFETLGEAKEDLFGYISSEVARVALTTADFVFVPAKNFKRRDKEALNEYFKEALLTLIFSQDKEPKDAFKSGFACGMDWILKSEGVCRRPVWANYLVQNQNGSQTWFECRPETDMHSGKWTATEGRSIGVCVHQELWYGSLRKLT